jgi:Holliday junction resolvase RusA-like endonuclease
MKFTLSIPVGINHLYKQGKHGWYKDSKAVDWQNEALWKLKKEKEKVTGESVYITWFFKDKRKHDIDSGLKLMLDTIVKAKIIKDDSLITFLQVEKQKTSLKENYCEVEII